MSYFFAFWIGVICASVIVKVLTIFSFIARLLRSYGICFLVYLELVGTCLCLLLGSLVAGKVVLVTIVMEIFGRSFLFVWCGVFGRREIVDVLKTLSILCLISSFFFSEPYLTGSLCGETNLFLFWIYLTFVFSVLDLFTPVYFLCTWVPLSFDINESFLLIKNFFFGINNISILLKIERLPNRVHWGCTMGAQIKKQKNNGQEKKKRKNKKSEKKPHSIQRECVRRKT